MYIPNFAYVYMLLAAVRLQGKHLLNSLTQQKCT